MWPAWPQRSVTACPSRVAGVATALSDGLSQPCGRWPRTGGWSWWACWAPGSQRRAPWAAAIGEGTSCVPWAPHLLYTAARCHRLPSRDCPILCCIPGTQHSPWCTAAPQPIFVERAERSFSEKGAGRTSLRMHKRTLVTNAVLLLDYGATQTFKATQRNSHDRTDSHLAKQRRDDLQTQTKRGRKSA